MTFVLYITYKAATTKKYSFFLGKNLQIVEFKIDFSSRYKLNL